MKLWSKICAFSLRAMGWTCDNDPVKDKLCVLLVAPHTSIFDFVIPYLYYTSKGATPHALVKKEFFFWPMGPFLKSLGGIPLDRKNPARAIKKVIDSMKNSDEIFHLAIAPEGTRDPVKKWKTGYHTIAKALDCPVYLGYIDWKTKHIGYKISYRLTDNAREDTDNIQRIYETMNVSGRHPEKFATR